MTLAALRALTFGSSAIRRTSAVLIGTAVVVAGLAAPASAADAAPKPRTSFSYDSAPGDFVGQGQSDKYVPSADTTVSVSGTEDELALAVRAPGEFWNVDISPGTGHRLEPGVYRHAERYAFRSGRNPGLDAEGDGRGCDQIFGKFTVNQISFDTAGNIDMVDLTFVQHCETAQAPPFTGTILLNRLPLSFKVISQPGDPVGLGEQQRYLNSTSVFTVTGTATSAQARVSGHGDNWLIQLQAPKGKVLMAGRTYDTTQNGDASHAGLNVSRGATGCSESTGTLTVKKIITDDDQAIRQLSLTFTQFCDGSTAPLNGTLHYLA